MGKELAKKYVELQEQNWRLGQACVLLFIFFAGALITLFVVAYYKDLNYNDLVAQNERLRQQAEMARSGQLLSPNEARLYNGLSWRDKGFFMVYTGTYGSCRSITDVLEACGHEWAHVCEGMKD